MKRLLVLALVCGLRRFLQRSLRSDPVILELFPQGRQRAPSDGGEEIWQERGQGYVDRSVKNVHRPTITVYRPPSELATGAAVVIFPGGGYSHLAIDKEGHDEAKWFRSQGVLAAVLKYRLFRPREPRPTRSRRRSTMRGNRSGCCGSMRLSGASIPRRSAWWGTPPAAIWQFGRRCSLTMSTTRLRRSPRIFL